MSDRAANGRFAPGVSGNPGGRPGLSPELRAKLNELTPRAIDRLVEAMNGPDDRLAIEASKALLDRALGRPQQGSDVTLRAEPMSASEAHLEALLEVARRRQQEPIRCGKPKADA